MTPHKIELERDRASGGAGLMPGTGSAGCPAQARFRQAVAPTQKGVKGASLRWRLTSLDRRSVKGRPRLVSFDRRSENPSWGGPLPRSAWREALDFVLFAIALIGVGLMALHVAMGRLG